MSIKEQTTYDLNSGVVDLDIGRPMELFGTAFRGGYDGWTFGEDGSFPMGAIRRERNAYPIEFLEDGASRDVSNCVLDSFTPTPFAVGTNSKLEEGAVMPSETVLTFDIDMSDPVVLAQWDQKMIKNITVRDYFHYIIATALGKGSGDKVK